MSAITITIFSDAEAWLRENVPLLSIDRVCCVRPITEFNPDGLTRYIDQEEDIEKDCTLDDHVKALQKLCEMVGHKLFVGGIKSPLQLVDAGNWDIEVADAFYQLVYRGEVIYG